MKSEPKTKRPYIRKHYHNGGGSHKLFERDGLYFIADMSGYTPDKTEDGELSILLNRPLQRLTGGSGRLAYILPLWSTRDQCECSAIIGCELRNHLVKWLGMKES